MVWHYGMYDGIINDKNNIKYASIHKSNISLKLLLDF